MTLSLQLYSMRDVPDQIALLAKLSEIGINSVEGFGGVYSEPRAYRAAMDANGIKMPSGHMALHDIEANFDATMGIVRAMGISRVFAPYLEEKDRPTKSSEYIDLAKRLNTASLRYAEHEVSFGWHNHDFEFVRLADGGIPMEILLENALDIKWEADLAWIVRGASDPLEYIARFGDRITALHVKDIAKPGTNLEQDGWADLGAGVLDWTSYLKACRSRSSDIIYVLEHDKPSDPIGYATNSVAAFKVLWEKANG